MSYRIFGFLLARSAGKAGRAARGFALTLLAIEFLDELADGSRQAAWPLIRRDLELSYTQIGMLLSVPVFISSVIEPLLGVLADVRRRRKKLILGGGIFFALSALLVAGSRSFAFLLLAFIIFAPAGGAFVSLSQAALMDSAPARHEQNMARWAFAGSLGVIAGSLGLSATLAFGRGWREWFVMMFFLALLLVAVARRYPFATPAARVGVEEQPASAALREGLRGAWRALCRRDVLRWLILLRFSDLMLDSLHGFLALYFVDVVGVTEERAGLAIAVWIGVGVVGDLLLIPLLERVRGLRYLRWSALVMLFLFPAFLLAPSLSWKIALLGLLGLGNSGWYSILKAQLYSALPRQSGTVTALDSIGSSAGALMPLTVGLVAQQLGLGFAMWLLLAGPVALFAAIPRAEAQNAK